jgi:hypothetical protein
MSDVEIGHACTVVQKLYFSLLMYCIVEAVSSEPTSPNGFDAMTMPICHVEIFTCDVV